MFIGALNWPFIRQQQQRQQQQEHCKMAPRIHYTQISADIRWCDHKFMRNLAHSGHCQCEHVNFHVAQVKGILVSTLKLPAKSNNVDILDWYVYHCVHTQACTFACTAVNGCCDFCRQYQINFGISAIRCLELLSSRCFTVSSSFISCKWRVRSIFSFSFSRHNHSVVVGWYFWYVFFSLLSLSLCRLICWRMRHMLFLSKSTTFTMERVHRNFSAPKPFQAEVYRLGLQKRQEKPSILFVSHQHLHRLTNNFFSNQKQRVRAF